MWKPSPNQATAQSLNHSRFKETVVNVKVLKEKEINACRCQIPLLTCLNIQNSNLFTVSGANKSSISNANSKFYIDDQKYESFLEIVMVIKFNIQ